MDELLNKLNEIVPDVDFENEDALVTEGVLDSFDIIAIVSELNEYYGIKIDVDDLEPENFDTVQAILDLVNKLK